MLLQDFYTIDQLAVSDEGKLEAHVTLNTNHEIYNGHFPGQPILPGVCLIEMVRGIVSGHLQQSLFFQGADQIKFMNIVDPQLTDHLTFKLSLEEQDGAYQVHNEARAGETTCFKMKGTFLPE